jgi:hypothetical protein
MKVKKYPLYTNKGIENEQFIHSTILSACLCERTQTPVSFP